MTVVPAKKRYTPAEYYALERDAAYKSDYYEGEIFDMSGGTSTHSQISANLIIALGSRLKNNPCRVFESNLRLKVSATGLRTYPDANVYCGPVEYDPEDSAKTTALNPTVVFEVLSPSTEGYDRGLKARSYRMIESLQAYVLVSQEQARAEIHERQPDGTWVIRDVSGTEGAIELQCIRVTLPFSEIYDRVELPPAAESSLPPQV